MRAPSGSVVSFAARVQPASVKELRCVGRTVRSLRWLRGSTRILRVVRGGRRVLLRLRVIASSCEQPASEPRVVEDPKRTRLEPHPAGSIPRGSPSRNGRSVAGSDHRFDIVLAVELRDGAGAREGE